MLDDKSLKKKYEKVFSSDPDKYYPTGFLRGSGLQRNVCRSCGRFFWSADETGTCGESGCSGGYTFMGRKRNSLDYPGVWKSFSSSLKKLGYTPVKRYPVAARWRDDIHFVEASIDDFMPYVINGVVRPPANPLTVPQFCLRFRDIENVGITGAHYTGFVMIGQHTFQDKPNYDPNTYLKHLCGWFENSIGINKHELFLHEDVWAGSGNFGPCVELFSGGLELANQVYMQFRQTESGYKDLNLKVLDMGMGQERVAWFSQGKGISYETTFPHVVSRLKRETGIVSNDEIVGKFLPYAGMLNSDEGDLGRRWRELAEKLDINVDVLMDEVKTLSSVYAVADHSRSLLIALTDGSLPSNSGGGYNLRVILRRSLDFIRRYNWKIRLNDIIRWHMEEMGKDYPEAKEMEKEIERIIKVEEERYVNTQSRASSTLRGAGQIGADKMVELYDSHGISAEMMKAAGMSVPDNFYELVAGRHASQKPKHEQEEEIKAKPTELLYIRDYELLKFDARVLKVDGDRVVLDRTAFYATAGGQDRDSGKINGQEVVDVRKVGGVVVHVVEGPKFKEGETVRCEVYWYRRKQLSQHHTAVHIVNGAARQVLGKHVWQAGAEKTIEKARLDITHYEALTKEEVREIEKIANDVVRRGITVENEVMPKDEAEKRFGFRVYQGGFVPGGELRIIRIGDFDVEACGGTHLKNTSEAGMIKITGTSKIQDGVVRIELKAGAAVQDYASQLEEIAAESCRMIGSGIKELPSRCEALFAEWKNARKGKPAKFTPGKYVEPRVKTFPQIRDAEDSLTRAAEMLRVQKEHIPKTIKRFIDDINRKK